MYIISGGFVVRGAWATENTINCMAKWANSVKRQSATENPLDGSIIHTYNSLRVNDHGCFHPGIFSDDIM